MYPKPEPRRKVKARTVRQFAALRQKCVTAVWKRDQHLCQYCGYWVWKPSETDQAFQVGHVHEIVSRAQGGDPTDPDNCKLACPRCHFNGPSGAHRRD